MKKIGLLLLLWALNVSAQIPEAVKKEVDLRIKHQHNPSIALAVYEDGQQYFYVNGWQNKSKQIKANRQTVYEIGSITKTFTGLLLAIQSDEGLVKLDDPVQQHWEKPFSLEDRQGHAITLKQLSTHTSGLPRLPNNIPVFADDPYADYDLVDLLEALANIQPLAASNDYAYSNLAVGFLGETLARVGGQSYNDLVTQKIIQPLLLESTYMTLQEVPAEHLATGYAGQKAVSAWNFKALAGAGSIRSSVNDLLAYGIAHIKQPGLLKSAMQLATTTHYQKDDLEVGLGWHINNDILWHNGGTGGFRSMLMIDPIHKRVVAAMTNHGRHDVEDLAVHLMNPKRPMRKHDFPVEIGSKALTEYSGNYQQTENDLKINLKIINDQLYFTAPKQPKQAMVYVGDDTFKFKMIGVKLKFIRSDHGDIQSLELHGWGDLQNYKKISN